MVEETACEAGENELTKSRFSKMVEDMTKDGVLEMRE